MKTPMQELIETFEEMRSPIDSKVDVDFAISLVLIDYPKIEVIFNQTFKTKEK